MPYSHNETNSWIADKIRQIQPKSILDVGAGAGTLETIVRNDAKSTATLDCVEVWEPYISRFNLETKYNSVFNIDARLFNKWDYDLVIFGDVLEHMTEAEAKDLWHKAARNCKYAIITIPIIHFPQGEEEGNPYEAHCVDDWNAQGVLDTFAGIVEHKEFKVTGAFFAAFPR